MTGTHDTHPLAPLDVAPRLGRLPRAARRRGQLDALLVTKLANVRYLTGFTGSAAMLLVTGDDALFVTDGRYTAARRHGRARRRRVPTPASRSALTGAAQHATARRRGRGRRAPRARGAQRHLGRSSATTRPRSRASSSSRPATLVEDLRRVKDAGEIDRIRRACAIADDAFQSLLPRLADGITERQFALELEFAMRERGASGNSFDPIIASGPNGAKPHHVPSDRVIGRNELVVCDFGCIVDGYCSDMTRTVSVGDPGPDARHLYDVVLASQQAGRALVAADVACADIDRASRDVIADAGWADAFSHSTGHGVGLEIHEAPRVAATGR